WDVLALNLAGRRPAQFDRGWNQWPEIVWTDAERGQWLGDLPHSWVAATFLHAGRTALVYERTSDQALVLPAGRPPRRAPHRSVARDRRAAARRTPPDLVGPARLRAAPHGVGRTARSHRRRALAAAGRSRARAAGWPSRHGTRVAHRAGPSGRSLTRRSGGSDRCRFRI